MKLRDSGMPDQAYWETLFDVPLILAQLGIGATVRDVAEFGCGYGTFTLPIAQAISGTLYTFDIDPAMVERTRQLAIEAGITNVECRERDVMQYGFDVPRSVDAALLFNILHCDEPKQLIGHALKTLERAGRLLVIHWRCDLTTPRGPSLDIRPKPEQIVAWAREMGLIACADTISLPPWHYGLVFRH